jgi:hypothetical protein
MTSTEVAFQLRLCWRYDEGSMNADGSHLRGGARREADVTDFLHAKVKEIEERLHQLRPLVTEYQRLEAAVAALDGLDGSASLSAGQRRRVRGNGNGSRAQNGNGNDARRGRPPGSRGENTRATEAVELVRTRPGITIPELAGHMGIKPNYLYRVLPQLEEDGKVRRIEKGWHPA